MCRRNHVLVQGLVARRLRPSGKGLNAVRQDHKLLYGQFGAGVGAAVDVFDAELLLLAEFEESGVLFALDGLEVTLFHVARFQRNLEFDVFLARGLEPDMLNFFKADVNRPGLDSINESFL